MVRVRRYYGITLADGRSFSGPQAHVIQHELDHLNGILLTDKEAPCV
jgi:peptide deformylase